MNPIRFNSGPFFVMRAALSVFCNVAVRTMDNVVVGVFVPIITLVHGFPLLTRSLKDDRLQPGSGIERSWAVPG